MNDIIKQLAISEFCDIDQQLVISNSYNLLCKS